MSAHNGDKARHHKQRKRRIAKRLKTNELRKDLAAAKTPEKSA